jgi:hypothetical protein
MAPAAALYPLAHKDNRGQPGDDRQPPSGRGAGGGLALGPAGCPAMEGGAALALQLSPAELNGRALAGVDPAMPE